MILSGEYNVLADLNEDGIVNVVDIVQMVDWILNGEIEVETCNDNEAINYNSDNQCIYDLCTDYVESNNNFNCETNGSSPYDIGEALGCETLETEFDTCYPEDCGTIKLADFEDKIIFIIYEQDW
jgi:hypothetical protein